jgi:hypothetical protein
MDSQFLLQSYIVENIAHVFRGNLVMLQEMGGGLRRGWTSNQQAYNCKIFIFPFQIGRHSIGQLESQQRTMLKFFFKKKILKNYL